MFDIESNNWTDFEMAGSYDGRDYRRHDSIESLLSWICRSENRGRIIFAHNGGRFDFLFLFDALKGLAKNVSLICQGPRITAIKIRSTDGHTITLQDSFALLPYSLQTLCETFKPAHSKLTGTIDFDRERVDRRNALHQRYLEADCRSLWEILEAYRRLPYIRDVGIKLTRSSAGLAAWRTTLTRPIRTTPEHVQNFVRGAYAGGRCEIYRQVMGEGRCVDVNSLYPAMMLKPLPVEYIGESSDASDFGFHDVTVSVPESFMPILWRKTPKLIFPTGIFRGTYFSEELRLAVENGAKILKHHRGLRFDSRADLFSDYIGGLYRLRKDNPHNPVLNVLAKDLMNHTYGKFAERELKTAMFKINPETLEGLPDTFKYFHSEKMFYKTGLILVDKWKRSPHMLCHIAAAVTAWGRVHMAENLYLPYQDKIAYTDTDSGFISAKFPSSRELGQFKEEYSIKQGFFLLPKGYYLEKTDGTIIKKLKGFSKKSLNSITYELFKKGNISVTEKKLAGFRSALIRENRFLAVLEAKKSVITEYNKRKILKGGETRPWHIKGDELI